MNETKLEDVNAFTAINAIKAEGRLEAENTKDMEPRQFHTLYNTVYEKAKYLKDAIGEEYANTEETSCEFDSEVSEIEGELFGYIGLLEYGSDTITRKGLVVIENRLNWLENYLYNLKSQESNK